MKKDMVVGCWLTAVGPWWSYIEYVDFLAEITLQIAPLQSYFSGSLSTKFVPHCRGTHLILILRKRAMVVVWLEQSSGGWELTL